MGQRGNGAQRSQGQQQQVQQQQSGQHLHISSKIEETDKQ